MAETTNISREIRRRRWNWIGNILRKNPADDCAVALGWRPEGRRKRGRPMTDGGGRRKQGGIELLEHSAPRSFRPQYVEIKCPSLMCLMARRELM